VAGCEVTDDVSADKRLAVKGNEFRSSSEGLFGFQDCRLQLDIAGSERQVPVFQPLLQVCPEVVDRMADIDDRSNVP
jgi:hypothetical protein